jgi:hypothetical protein
LQEQLFCRYLGEILLSRHLLIGIYKNALKEALFYLKNGCPAFLYSLVGVCRKIDGYGTAMNLSRLHPIKRRELLGGYIKY